MMMLQYASRNILYCLLWRLLLKLAFTQIESAFADEKSFSPATGIFQCVGVNDSCFGALALLMSKLLRIAVSWWMDLKITPPSIQW
jgi:hypothetical protein